MSDKARWVKLVVFYAVDAELSFVFSESSRILMLSVLMDRA